MSELDLQEPSSVAAWVAPEGPNVAAQHISDLLPYVTPNVLVRIAETVLTKLGDDLAHAVLMNWLCRQDESVWATVAEQSIQLVTRHHDKAIDALEEADALAARAAVIRCNATAQRRACEVAALTILRALPTKLAAELFGDELEGVG